MLGLLLAGSAAAQATLPEAPVPTPVEESVQVPAAPTVVDVRLMPLSKVDETGLAELVAVIPGQALSTRAVRRSVERLWATERFSNIVVRSRDVPGGVKVVFELTPVEVLGRLTVEGNTVLRDAALQAVLKENGLAVRQRLDAEVLAAARAGLLRAYGQQGYNEAQVHVEEGEPVPAGTSLVFKVVEGTPTRVAAVSVMGSPGLPLSELLSTLGLKVGGVLDRSGLDAGLERLRRLLRERRYWRAQVGVPELTREGDATVVLPLSAGPRFTFHFHGNHHYSDSLLERVVVYDGTEPLDSATVARLARRLESFYRYRGFHDVRVETREVPRPDGEEAVLAFDIEEGHPLRVSAVSFQGNTVLSSAALAEVLVERIRAKDPLPEDLALLRAEPMELAGRGRGAKGQEVPRQEPSTVFVEEAYREAAEAMTELYREQGFLQAEVRFERLRVDVPGRTADASFTVVEGPRVLASEVSAEGGPDSFEALPKVPLKVGDPLSPDAVEQGRQAMLAELAREGYLFARVDADLRLERPEAARIRYRLEPGPQVKVGRVLIQGLSRTESEVVRATLRVKEDTVLDSEAMFESQRRLALLNIFRSVTVRMDRPEVPEPIKDVVVEVRERPRTEGEVAAGYFLVDGPRLVLDLVYPNVGGHGLNLSGRMKLNYVGLSAQVLDPAVTAPTERERLQGPYGLGGRGTLSASLPRLYGLLPVEVGARLDLIGERVHRPSYLSTRGATVAGLDWSATRWLSLSLQYELELNLLQSSAGLLTTQSRADQERLRFPFGLFLLHSLKPSATVDLRDDPANPRKGLVVSTSAELTRGLYSQPLEGPQLPINGVKLMGNVSVYAPLGPKAVLALSTRAGTIVPLEQDAQVLGSKRFFLGGSTTLRGFREDGILAEDRRTALRTQLENCRAVIHPTGCTEDLLAVLGGRSPTSEGGELFTLAKAEVRFPVRASLDLGIFLEAGNLWLDRTQFVPTALRWATGVGLRYVTPVGPLAFDLGVNLDPDDALNEPATQLHFSIGTF